MTVLTIRSHKRFAVCHGVTLSNAERHPVDGMLIELSLGGCRISNLDGEGYAPGQALSVEVAGFGALSGEVRWSGGGIVGLRFNPPLHVDCLERLVKTCRREHEPATPTPMRASA